MLRSSRLWTFVALSHGIAVFGTACLDSSDSSPPAGPDAGAVDARANDGAPPDATTPDGAPIDGTAPDEASVEASADAPTDVSVIHGSAGGTALFDKTLGPALYGAASDNGSAVLIAAGRSAPMTIPITFSYYEPGVGWTVPAEIPATSTTWDSNRTPAVGIDGTGNVFVTWAGYDANSIYHIYVSRLDHATMTWSTPVKPDSYSEKISPEVALAVAPSGDAMILTVHSGATTQHEIYALHYTGGAWKGESVLPQTAGVVSNSSIVRLQDNGRAAVAWIGNAGQGIATRDTAGVWTAGPALTGVGLSDISDIALNAGGDVLFASQSSSEPQTFRYSAAQASWTGPTSLGTTSSPRDACLKVALATNGDGVLTHCFQTVINAPLAIESYVYTAGAWGTAKALATLGRVFDYQIAYASSGDAVAVWLEAPGDTGTTAAPETSRFSAATGWSGEPSPLTDVFDVNNQTAAAFVSPNGQHAWAAWTQSDAGAVQKMP